ncbi:MAG: hypothetical protein WDM77_10700 [Steroidobacteraceae bacterium]
MTGLQKTIALDTDPLTLVFIHGVSDHCRGYAVGDQKHPKSDLTAEAWLNPKIMEKLGLVPKPSSDQIDTEITGSAAGVGTDKNDKTNVVLLRRRDFSMDDAGKSEDS